MCVRHVPRSMALAEQDEDYCRSREMSHTRLTQAVTDR